MIRVLLLGCVPQALFARERKSGRIRTSGTRHRKPTPGYRVLRLTYLSLENSKFYDPAQQQRNIPFACEPVLSPYQNFTSPLPPPLQQSAFRILGKADLPDSSSRPPTYLCNSPSPGKYTEDPPGVLGHSTISIPWIPVLTLYPTHSNGSGEICRGSNLLSLEYLPHPRSDRERCPWCPS